MSVVKAKLIGFVIRNCQGGCLWISGVLDFGVAAVRGICGFVISLLSRT